MRKLQRALLTRFLLILVGAVFFSSFVTYLVVATFFLDKGLEVQELNSLYLIIIPILIFTLFLAFYFYKKTIDKISDEIEELKNYLKNISMKNYQSIIRVRYFQDFLEISLLLKNIVKRLNNKDKKKK